MSMHNERMQILGMIQSGQISAEEGARLLAALKSGGKEGQTTEAGQPRWFRVRITDLKSGKTKVNVNIPMTLVDVGIKMGARFVPDAEGVNYSELAEAIRGGAQGKVIDLEDEEREERVEIFVE
ncbi:MAG TPA: hypothetical protein PKJ21_05710 [Anaerolineae bacterium]|nr:hypothetical protein [Anaerolineae bacterium]HNT05654.1 hypothetical protein [Anaerolineae bacterium]HOU23077.1 hypothetical protein [Anaerolineae bacterium]HQJ51571.1 hypothetical protein [Anaerolineae bacterium]